MSEHNKRKLLTIEEQEKLFEQYGAVPGRDGCDGRDGRDGGEGPAGPPGLHGKQGKQGCDGSAGPEGPRGRNGVDGADGCNGKDGRDGRDGDRGPEGPEGKKGEKGEPGKNGDNGEDGAPGEPGEPGDNGKDGTIVTCSKSGDTVTIFLDGTPECTIKDGVKGDDGPPGDAGDDGTIVTCDKTDGVATIFLDGVPACVISDGDDGDDGVKGDDGNAGTVVSCTKNNGVATILFDGVAGCTISDGDDGNDGADGTLVECSVSDSTLSIVTTDPNTGAANTCSLAVDGSVGTDTNFYTTSLDCDITDDNLVISATVPGAPSEDLSTNCDLQDLADALAPLLSTATQKYIESVSCTANANEFFHTYTYNDGTSFNSSPCNWPTGTGGGLTETEVIQLISDNVVCEANDAYPCHSDIKVAGDTICTIEEADTEECKCFCLYNYTGNMQIQLDSSDGVTVVWEENGAETSVGSGEQNVSHTYDDYTGKIMLCIPACTDLTEMVFSGITLEQLHSGCCD